jgi:hypothetical protein
MSESKPFYLPADDQGFQGVYLDSVYFKTDTGAYLPPRIEYPAWDIRNPMPFKESAPPLGTHLEITRLPFLGSGVVSEYIPQFEPKDNYFANLYGIREQSDGSSFTEGSSYVARLGPKFILTEDEEAELSRLYALEGEAVRDKRVNAFRSTILPAILYGSEAGFSLEKQPFRFGITQDFDVSHTFGDGTLRALNTEMEWREDNGTEYRGSMAAGSLFFEFGIGKELLEASQKEVHWYAGIHVDLKSLGTLDSRMRAAVAQRAWDPEDFYRTICPTLSTEIVDINS